MFSLSCWYWASTLSSGKALSNCSSELSVSLSMLHSMSQREISLASALSDLSRMSVEAGDELDELSTKWSTRPAVRPEWSLTQILRLLVVEELELLERLLLGARVAVARRLVLAQL